MRTTRGFTMIEIAIVLVIVGLLILAAYPFLRTSTGEAQLQRSTWELADTIRRAQVQSMNGEQDSVWGVRFDTASYDLFKGPSYDASDPQTITYELSGQVTITSVSLNGGGTDMVFDRSRGTTSQNGTIELTDAVSGSTRVITVNKQGQISHN